ncbi:xylose isomerase-like [Hyalella azteca]|uniref:Xylose isomerase n=1 Tax=Hyalella azteca TaxID=294128 RepID=A0A8B7P402_HYAAZ|nr:xylose isomerase-like [Hyalella azteca]
MSSKFTLDNGKVEYRPNAGAEETQVYRYYNASENLHGKTMEEWLRFSVCCFNAFRYQGSDDYYGDWAHVRPWDDRSRHLDNYKRRLQAAVDLASKLGIKYYSVSDRDLCPDYDDFEETSRALDDMTVFALELQKQHNVKPLYFGCDLFTHPRYMNGASTSPDALVFAYASAQLKRGLEAAKKLGTENFVFFHPRDGYQSLIQRQVFKDLSHLAQFYKMAVQYKEKIGYRGQFLIQPKPFDPRRCQYESDAASTLHILRHFNLDKHFKLYIKPGWSRMLGRKYEHDVYYASAFKALGAVDASDNWPEVNGAADVCPYNVRDATYVMKCVVEQGGLQPGGLNLGFRTRREAAEPQDQLDSHVLAIDTFARALRAAVATAKDGLFARNLKERYSSYNLPVTLVNCSLPL